MANVTFDDAARSDPRYALLGQLLGTGKFDARGRMLEVWSYCTEFCTYFVRPQMLDVIAERENFGQLLVEVGLAEQQDDGTFRIRGTRGRVEWLKKLRKNAKKGGDANRARLAAKRKPPGNPGGYPGGYPEGQPSGHPEGEPSYSYSYSDSDPVLTLPEERVPDSGAHAVAQHLAAAIRDHSPRAKLQPAKWVEAIDLAMRLDGRTADELKRVVDFAHRAGDGFWRPNLRSGEKLREHFDRISSQADRAGFPPAKGSQLPLGQLVALPTRPRQTSADNAFFDDLERDARRHGLDKRSGEEGDAS